MKNVKAFSAIGFEGDELNYLENLVTYQISKPSLERDDAYSFVAKKNILVHFFIPIQNQKSS